jgi:hypothetical protein
MAYCFVAFNAPPLLTETLNSVNVDNNYDSDFAMLISQNAPKRPQVTKYPVYFELSSNRNNSANNRNNNVNPEAAVSCTVTIRCDGMELVGELIQDLAKFLNIAELSSIATFPKEIELFEDVCFMRCCVCCDFAIHVCIMMCVCRRWSESPSIMHSDFR